jgi:hypothetical protein
VLSDKCRVLSSKQTHYRYKKRVGFDRGF